MPSTIDALISKARTMTKQSHARYSDFHVGCGLETEAGGIYGGCNVESVSFSATICAERTAIVAAVAAEGPTMRIKQLAISVDPLIPLLTPCGVCRQLIAEFGRTETEIHCDTPGGTRTFTLGELLPYGFLPDDLPTRSPAADS